MERGPKMTKQLLYYERAVPVTLERHRDWALEPRKTYEFADHANAVPIVVAEFPLWRLRTTELSLPARRSRLFQPSPWD
jgi:hypothetical protein